MSLYGTDNNDDEQLKIELLSQWKLEAEFRNSHFWIIFFKSAQFEWQGCQVGRCSYDTTWVGTSLQWLLLLDFSPLRVFIPTLCSVHHYYYYLWSTRHPLVARQAAAAAHMIPPSLPGWQFDIPPGWSMIATNLLEPILIHCYDFWLNGKVNVNFRCVTKTRFHVAMCDNSAPIVAMRNMQHENWSVNMHAKRVNICQFVQENIGVRGHICPHPHKWIWSLPYFLTTFCCWQVNIC